MSKRSEHKKTSRGRWIKLWKRWKSKDVCTVDQNHRRFKVLECVREGIQNLFSNHPELAAKDLLTESDLCHIHEKEITISTGKTLVFKSYASSVFACIRNAVCVSDADFLSSVAPENLPYMEFVSNSKSGQDFFLSHDQQFILKTDKKYYLDFFMSFLGEYLVHFENHPHSLIVKFLGLYSVGVAKKKPVYFLVMQNVFFPVERIETRFDIKGCLGGRYQRPFPKEKGVLTVLKDQNFEKEKLDLGEQRHWFHRQLHLDVEFLRDLGVQDYSLLIGRHRLHIDDQQKTFGTLVQRMRKTFARRRSSTVISRPDHSSNKISPYIPEESHSQSRCQGDLDKTFTAKNGNLRLFRGISSLLDPTSDNDNETANRRLLLDCKNPLHVIDGTYDRYYFGIIDFFTRYECKQRLARIYKIFKYCTCNHSTVPPDVYADRFLKFLEERTILLNTDCTNL